jgi:hypothetical protein
MLGGSPAIKIDGPVASLPLASPDFHGNQQKYPPNQVVADRVGEGVASLPFSA